MLLCSIFIWPWFYCYLSPPIFGTHTYIKSAQPLMSPPSRPCPISAWALRALTLPLIPFTFPLPGVLSAPCGCQHNRGSVLIFPWKTAGNLSHACSFSMSSPLLISFSVHSWRPLLLFLSLFFVCCFWRQLSLRPPEWSRLTFQL